MKRGTYVKRSTYQKVCEENKKLIADLKTICCSGDAVTSVDTELKWRKHFEEEEKFNSLLREVLLTHKHEIQNGNG